MNKEILAMLSDEGRKTVEDALKRAKDKLREDNVPFELAECITIAQKVFRLNFLAEGLMVFYYTYGVATRLYVEMSRFGQKKERISNTLEQLVVGRDCIVSESSGDYISRYCENSGCKKEKRDELLAFSKTLTMLIESSGLPEKIANSFSMLTMGDLGNRDILRAMSYSWLGIDRDSLIEQMFDCLKGRGFGVISSGFGLIRRAIEDEELKQGGTYE